MDHHPIIQTFWNFIPFSLIVWSPFREILNFFFLFIWVFTWPFEIIWNFSFYGLPLFVYYLVTIFGLVVAAGMIFVLGFFTFLFGWLLYFPLFFIVTPGLFLLPLLVTPFPTWLTNQFLFWSTYITLTLYLEMPCLFVAADKVEECKV